MVLQDMKLLSDGKLSCVSVSEREKVKAMNMKA